MASPWIISRFFKSSENNGFTLAELNRIIADGTIAISKLVGGTSPDFGAGPVKVDAVQQSTAGTGVFKLKLSDNLANALDIIEGANSYLKFVTTNAGEDIVATKHITASAGVTGNVTGNLTGQASALAPASCTVSGEQTGTGAPQTVAHGLGATPSAYWVWPSGLSGGVYVVSGLSADATNVTVTVTLGEKFRVSAIK